MITNTAFGILGLCLCFFFPFLISGLFIYFYKNVWWEEDSICWFGTHCFDLCVYGIAEKRWKSKWVWNFDWKIWCLGFYRVWWWCGIGVWQAYCPVNSLSLSQSFFLLVCTWTIIPLSKPKLYSILRFENEKEKKKKNNNFIGYGYMACLFDGGRFFFVYVVVVLMVYVWRGIRQASCFLFIYFILFIFYCKFF